MGRFPKRRPNTVFVVVVDRRPILAFEAFSQAEARELIREGWFLSDLRRATSDGKPLWDGAARLNVRVANCAEAKKAGVAFTNESTETEDLKLTYLTKIDGLRQN